MFSDRRATVILTAGLVISSALFATGASAVPETYRDGEILHIQDPRREPMRSPNGDIRLPNGDIVSEVDLLKRDRNYNSRREIVRLPNGDIIIRSND